MHGASSGTGNSGLGPPAEDIDNILTRFQEWSRKGPPTPNSTSPTGLGRSTPSKKVNLAPGARELSYEEALLATSYRRQVYPVPASAALPKSPPAPSTANSPEADSATTTPNVTSIAPAAKVSSNRSPKPLQAVRPRAKRRARATAPSVVETGPAVLADATTQHSKSSQTASAQPSLKRQKNARNGERKPSGPSNGRNHVPRSNLTPIVPVERVLIEQAPLRSSISPEEPRIIYRTATQGETIQPAFREVLQQSAGLAANSNEGAVLENKTIALSLRVSDAEQTRIQACAANANISVSAYLRQCALGVEELRDQVELALGELRKRDAYRTPQLGLSAIPRILRDAAVGWFRRLRGNRDSITISLR